MNLMQGHGDGRDRGGPPTAGATGGGGSGWIYQIYPAQFSGQQP